MVGGIAADYALLGTQNRDHAVIISAAEGTGRDRGAVGIIIDDSVVCSFCVVNMAVGCMNEGEGFCSDCRGSSLGVCKTEVGIGNVGLLPIVCVIGA